MKKCLPLLLCLMAAYAYAQNSPCPTTVLFESFENYSGLFENGNTGDWCASHGRPDVQQSGGVCHGSRSAEIRTGADCPPGPVLPEDITPEGGGILHTFDPPLEPGDYRISFCYCAKPYNGNQSSFEMNVSVSFTNLYSCVSNAPLTDVLPQALSGGGNSNYTNLVYSHNFNPYNNSSLGNCHSSGQPIEVSELAFSLEYPCSQLWIHGSQVGEDCNADGDICVDNILLESMNGELPCHYEEDLTACAHEDNYGFIAIECEATFEWDFPAGSTALEYTTKNQSIIVNASEGIYSLTMVDEEGCIEERTFEITADCCEKNPCPITAPTDLGCKSIFGGTSINWSPVPGASSYIINFFPGGGSCCNNAPSLAYAVQVDDPNYTITNNLPPCMTWNVRAKCISGELSPPSVDGCLNSHGCSLERANGDINNASSIEGSIKAYPNPARDVLNIEISDEVAGETGATLSLVDLLGKEVLSKSIKAGQLNESIAIDQLSNGIYWLRITNKQGLNLSQEIAIIK